MNFIVCIVVLAPICLSCAGMLIPTPPPPTPSPKATECMNKVMNRGICGTSLDVIFRPNDKPFDTHECCDFKNFFDCLLSQAKGLNGDVANGAICLDDEIDDLFGFIQTTLDYMHTNKCPGINWDICTKYRRFPHHHSLRIGLGKLESNPGYLNCLDSVSLDSQCLVQWYAIKCREEFVDIVCTQEEVFAVREYNERLIQEIDSGICQNDVLVEQ